MEIILKDGVKFTRHNFETENQFEKVVFSEFKSIFGENAILFNKQKIKTATGIGTIPDAFVISPDKLKWYIIEVELSTHNVYSHIIPQITRFKNALDNVQTRRTLSKYFDKAIEEDFNKLASWVSATNDKSVFRLLSEILENEPQLLIIIDDINEELAIASKNLPFDTRINIFKTFCRDGFGLGDNIYQFDTFNSAKKIVKDTQGFSNKKQDPFEKKEKKPRLKAPSPSPNEWLKQIPELSGVTGLYNWVDVCEHFNLKPEGNSARRVLQKWIKNNKPTWTPVPNA